MYEKPALRSELYHGWHLRIVIISESCIRSKDDVLSMLSQTSVCRLGPQWSNTPDNDWIMFIYTRAFSLSFVNCSYLTLSYIFITLKIAACGIPFGSVVFITQVIPILKFRYLSLILVILSAFEIFILFDCDNNLRYSIDKNLFYLFTKCI